MTRGAGSKLVESSASHRYWGGIDAMRAANAVKPIVDRLLSKLGRNGNSVAPPTPIDPNKLHHIFDKAEHNLGPVVQRFGSQEPANRAIQLAAESYVRSTNLTGRFEIIVDVAESQVTVGGAVVDGAVKMGTAFIP